MIVSKVCGGLAGQMFQYALGRHLALKNNDKLYLDLSWYERENNSGFVRDFALSQLDSSWNTLTEKHFLCWKIKVRSKTKNFNIFNFQYIKEADFSKFDPQVLNLEGNVILDGYWNSHKYFESIREILLNELRPKEAPDERNRRCLEKVENVNAVSVHFRRGDYALNSFHGMLDKEYYTKAIETISEKISNPYLFIFSDEPEWVLANMTFQHPYEIVDFNRDRKNYWDIELMRNCKHNIIANSGFSWWGAWLNTHENKLVIAPKKWVNIGKPEFDNIPPNWILF
jgi:hypothetical protein